MWFENLMVVLGAMALLVRFGYALYGTGLARSKNAAGAVLRNVCDLCLASLAFWFIGYALYQQDHNGILGLNPRLIAAWANEADSPLFFTTVVILIGTGIVNGIIGERAKFGAACFASIVLAGLVLPITAHWTWLGWLRQMGMVDVAGASALHVAAGAFAAIGAFLAGPRSGKYNRDGSSNAIPGHSVPLASAGVVAVLIGWIPYIAGCTLHFGMRGFVAGLPDTPASNVLFAAAAGGFVSLLYGQLRYGKPEVYLTFGGLLGALVAISAAGGAVSTPAAVAIGAIAGFVVPLATVLIDLWWKIDDPTGGIAIHLVGGIWGMLATAIFFPVPFANRLKLLGTQALGILAIAGLSVVIAFALFGTLRAMGRLRANEADEYDGLDLAEHDLNAYPDFQQTMIKSYHLREA
ncbi:MAG TPA: hypothetical protein VIL86_07945 [Tepidisphaeraceae bacterium]|jgi:Amt family ammonium transporter